MPELEPKLDRPIGCEQCPLNIENKPATIPYPVRVGVAMFAGLILATQCYSIKYDGQQDSLPGEGVEVTQVGRWTVETREPNYLFAAGCAAIAMTALGIKIDSLFKLLPGQR